MDKKPKKQPRKISRQYLENAALYYLQRYATTSENLKRVLCRKIERSCAFHGENPADFLPLVEDMIVRYTAVGLLNDRVYAEAKTATLRRGGRSRRAISAKLQAKGLSSVETTAALDAVDAGSGSADPEFDAGLTHARKKKIGPFRTKKTGDPQKDLQKDLAAMARAGFSYDIARRVLQASETET